ncbi:MAG: T9SS type A sorting domain-containing protein [Salibacteraceae bacterium]|nr:T9SS type A sorting domain-containing protein [Salibacteraceae bacterium]
MLYFRSLTLFTILLIGFVLLVFKSNESSVIENSEALLKQKFAPYDHFDMMRSFPDTVPDYEGIDQALHAAYQHANSGIRSNGFDEYWVIEGPGNIGARINTIATIPGNLDTFYIGYGRGGIFRTYDGGSNWESIFDDQERLCIGSIAINPQNHATLYAGTGDKNIGGSFSTGIGVFKSTDNGDTWTNIGLENQRIVSRIAINPIDTTIIYAATMGNPSLPGNDRGLYKSIDAGNTWNQILFVGDTAGINEIIIHPQNPDILYASGWNRYRSNQASIVSGNAGKIWKSTDAGATWTVLTNGLPSGPQGRVGISMFTPNPDTLYALYVGTDSELEGIYRTFNGGDSWTSVPTVANGVSASALGGFGWYFSSIHVNPYDYQDVFFDGVQLWRTQNGGMSWSEADPPWWTYDVHADKHDMAFLSPSTYLIATDGGLYRTTDAGSLWVKIENNKTNEIYRVEHTHHTPNSYYGGLQDNGSTGGNALIANWPRIYGGDGFQMRFHPNNPNLFYAETQNGNIVFTEDGGSFWDNTNFPQSADRTNWDTPYMLSHHDPTKMYAAGHQVFRDDFSPYGIWSAISGDLTDGNIFGSSFHTISGFDESQINPNRLYACTSDGNVWRTTNGGTSWDSIHTSLPNRYVTSVKASPSNQNHLFVTHSGYKYNDFFSHVHKSTDNGNGWVSIAGDLPPVAINDIVIYPNHADSVLFVGTDAGVYATKDGGLDWERLGANMPIIAVLDLTIDTINNRLVAATVGKSIMTYPLDSLVMPSNGNLEPIELTFTIEAQTCYGSGNGSINVDANGGTPPFDFWWSNGSLGQSINDLLAGNYIVTVSDAGGAQTVQSVIVPSNPIYPNPTVGPINGAVAVQAWQSYNYTAAATSGSLFEWNVFGGSLVNASGNAANILWSAGPTGSFEITETDVNGCKTTELFQVGIDFVGINEAAQELIKVYPNPSKGNFNVELPNQTKEIELELRNALGQIVFSEILFDKSQFTLDLNLKPGTYLLSCDLDQEPFNRWIVIE